MAFAVIPFPIGRDSVPGQRQPQGSGFLPAAQDCNVTYRVTETFRSNTTSEIFPTRRHKTGFCYMFVYPGRQKRGSNHLNKVSKVLGVSSHPPTLFFPRSCLGVWVACFTRHNFLFAVTARSFLERQQPPFHPLRPVSQCSHRSNYTVIGTARRETCSTEMSMCT